MLVPILLPEQEAVRFGEKPNMHSSRLLEMRCLASCVERWLFAARATAVDSRAQRDTPHSRSLKTRSTSASKTSSNARSFVSSRAAVAGATRLRRFR